MLLYLAFGPAVMVEMFVGVVDVSTNIATEVAKAACAHYYLGFKLLVGQQLG